MLFGATTVRTSTPTPSPSGLSIRGRASQGPMSGSHSAAGLAVALAPALAMAEQRVVLRYDGRPGSISRPTIPSPSARAIAASR